VGITNPRKEDNFLGKRKGGEFGELEREGLRNCSPQIIRKKAGVG